MQRLQCGGRNAAVARDHGIRGAHQNIIRIVTLERRTNAALFPDLTGNTQNVLGYGVEFLVESFH